jgi:hypothetical protein
LDALDFKKIEFGEFTPDLWANFVGVTKWPVDGFPVKRQGVCLNRIVLR